MILLLVACAHHAPADPSAPPALPTLPATIPTATLPAKECTSLREMGMDKARAHDLATASTTWTQAYASCGPGYGYLGLLALLQADGGDLDGAAKLAARELTEPTPLPPAVQFIATAYPRLSPSTRSWLVGLGSTPEAPLVVPDIGAEYAWAQYVLCDGAEPKVDQALSHEGDRDLDLLLVSCGPLDRLARYFDFAADPMEKAFREQLQALPQQTAPTP